MLNELKAIAKDEGVLLFFLFLPIAYPLLYSWIYNNEVVHDVPVALIDNSHTAMSREFVSKIDATPDVLVAYHCTNMEEAKDLIGKNKVRGIIFIPSDFERKIGRGEQAHVSVYCDMSYMLYYKAIFMSATAVALDMGAEIQKQLLGNMTAREDEISTLPLAFDEVSIFNAPAGYGNFIIPGVLILIIQQAMLLGVGMISGTEREKAFVRYARRRPRPILAQTLDILGGKVLAYVAIFSIMLAWITLVVPHIFGFVSIVHGKDLLLFLTPYLLACTFFSITFCELVRYRESVMLVVVFTSVPLLFMSGISWPLSNIPGVWQGVSTLFPSTYGIRGFVRMSSMGALLPDVTKEWQALWIQTICYACTATLVILRRVKIAETAQIEEGKETERARDNKNTEQ